MIQLADIERIAPGVANLSPEEHEALQRFTLLWTLFEAQVLENNASVRKISEIVDSLDVHVVEGDWFKEQLVYFRERYVEDGNTNYRFGHLHLRNNDNPERVRSVLVENNEDPKTQLIACLTIVYRFRNNFFHGLKWAYGLQDQFDNFTHSANLLKMCLEKIPHGI
ncbi:hypothetical protein Q4490_10310 [Neptunomonas phycophila]|uniref:Uncharacterized protein n=1 Tax=Neptunomonas phycophila TaxID=1572645 RepID=A0AAW7XHR9_9GAMM|nr:hypothetical protein [Neptunomonas phycophila]MDO6453956.1 hypothetical protein [Neptunomonas phycophila]